MRLSRLSSRTSPACLALLAGILLTMPVHAITLLDSVTITLEATFTAPPCTLTVPDTVNLGSITYGDKRYQPFTMEVTCTATSKTEIYAQALGTLAGGSADTVEMGDSLTLLWLEEGGKKIVLNGDTDLTTSGFCKGDTSRTCTLTPNTRVDVNARTGARSAVIRFNIRYT